MKITLTKGHTYFVFIPAFGSEKETLRTVNYIRNSLGDLGANIGNVAAMQGLTQVQFIEVIDPNPSREKLKAKTVPCKGRSGVSKVKCERLTRHPSGKCPFHREEIELGIELL